jgi:DNA-binding LytR/AlgR family response regulator
VLGKLRLGNPQPTGQADPEEVCHAVTFRAVRTLNGAGLRALIVDDEAPARAELAYLLGTDERIGSVTIAENATQALRTLADSSVDVVFSDIKMPGLSGLDLARAAAERRPAPRIVFVTAYDIHAVDAFELAATDYLMKPVRPQRLREAVRRVIEESEAAAVNEPDESIPVELAGVTRFVQRSEVRYVEAQGDYARLHTDAGSHLVRVPLNTLEERWASAGFVRIHRSTLIQLDRVSEVRLDSGRCNVTVAGVELAVSRRHTRALRELLLRRGATTK